MSLLYDLWVSDDEAFLEHTPVLICAYQDRARKENLSSSIYGGAASSDVPAEEKGSQRRLEVSSE